MLEELRYMFGLGETTFYVILLVLSIIVIIVSLWIIRQRHKKGEKITNSQFNGHRTGINEDTGQIALCSAIYPDVSGRVWLASKSSLTIIDSKKNALVLFSKIQSMEIREMSGANILSFKTLQMRRHDASGDGSWGVEDRHETSSHAPIAFKKEDTKFAQAICDRISESATK